MSEIETERQRLIQIERRAWILLQYRWQNKAEADAGRTWEQARRDWAAAYNALNAFSVRHPMEPGDIDTQYPTP